MAQAATRTSAALYPFAPARLELAGELTDASTTATPNSLTTRRYSHVRVLPAEGFVSTSVDIRLLR